MSDRKVNIPLLRKAVEWAENEATKGLESEWQQNSWISDYDLMREHYRRLARESHNAELRGRYKKFLAELPQSCGTAYCIAGYVGQVCEPQFTKNSYATIGGGVVHVADYASEQLGLGPLESAQLFHADNDIETVRAVAERIAGEPL